MKREGGRGREGVGEGEGGRGWRREACAEPWEAH